jgi:hypothetical protein
LLKGLYFWYNSKRILTAIFYIGDSIYHKLCYSEWGYEV